MHNPNKVHRYSSSRASFHGLESSGNSPSVSTAAYTVSENYSMRTASTLGQIPDAPYS